MDDNNRYHAKKFPCLKIIFRIAKTKKLLILPTTRQAETFETRNQQALCMQLFISTPYLSLLQNSRSIIN